jgi:hypothetical protein
MFICETFNKQFYLQKKQLEYKSTLMEIYEETHIRNGDKRKRKKRVLIQE